MTTKDRTDALAALLRGKEIAYGTDNPRRVGHIMSVLYPEGITASQMADAALVVRVIDKLARIAGRPPGQKDPGGESPWKDIAGYAVRGWEIDEP